MKDDIQEKKAAIIKVAYKLFNERGFNGTPTSLISKESGVATGTLFRYFPTKEELINYAYASAKNHMALAIKAGIDGDLTIDEKALHIWRNMILWGLQNPEEFLFIEQFASSPYITKLTEKEAMSNFGFLAEVLEEGVRNGSVKDIRGRLMADMIFDSSKAVVNKVIREGKKEAIDELIDVSFDLLWRGIGKH